MKSAATNDRTFRTFLLVAQLEAEAIGMRIRQARDEAGMTQEELADVARGFSKRSLQDYEAGVTIPYKHMQEIASITGKRAPGGSAPDDEHTFGVGLNSKLARMQAVMVVVSLFVCAPVAMASDQATPKRWYWTEEKAEAVAAAKIRIRYCLVFTTDARCVSDPSGKHGFYGVNEISCVGADEKGESFTFSRFRCRFVAGVRLYDYAAGRLLLYPAGPTAFRWKLSSIGRIR